jgi:hypothetical protein
MNPPTHREKLTISAWMTFPHDKWTDLSRIAGSNDYDLILSHLMHA